MAEAMAHRGELSSELLERLCAIVGGAVFVLDADGRITLWPARAARLTDSRRRTRLAGMLLYRPGDVAAGEPERDLALAALHGRHTARGLRLRRGGSRYRARMLITKLVDGMDHLTGFCCVLRDHSRALFATDSPEAVHALSPSLLATIALTVGYAVLLDAQPDPELLRVARRAPLPLRRAGPPGSGFRASTATARDA